MRYEALAGRHGWRQRIPTDPADDQHIVFIVHSSSLDKHQGRGFNQSLEFPEKSRTCRAIDDPVIAG